MPRFAARNRRFLTDLFCGPFRGHAMIMPPPWPAAPERGDFVVGSLPLEAWLRWVVEDYTTQVRWHETLGDDSVPYARLWTGTEFFPVAFGADHHIFDDSPPAGRPLVFTAAEADALPLPSLDARPFDRVWRLGELVRRELGPDVPIGIPDIQSPFDIAAILWNKEDLYVALYETPDAVKRLVDKCHALLAGFLTEFRQRLGEVNYCMCPLAWYPPDAGINLAEDECGAMSTSMFEEFCLPHLQALSAQFGGLFMHCCATADHQYANFRRVPNVWGLNRAFQYPPGQRPAIETFSGHSVLICAWVDLPWIEETLAMALPETRFLFAPAAQPLEESRRTLDRLRELCPRTEASEVL